MLSTVAPTRLQRALGRLRRRGAPARPLPAAPAASAWAVQPPPGTWIGPAQVRGSDADGRPRVLLTDALATEVTATWALPYRYLPVEGDLLLVIGRGGRYWVTGVLAGRGCSLIALGHEAALRARGRLRLRGGRGVRVTAPRIGLRATAIEVAVDVLHEKLGEALRTARRLRERAGASRRVVDEDDHQVAGARTLFAQGEVRIDGQLLQIG